MLSGSNVIVDISHYNDNVDFENLRTQGILGVIHKATQGIKYRDDEYPDRRKQARDAGLLWGAYHFGTNSEGVQQAEHFLEVVGDPVGIVLVLDFESNPVGPSMTLEEARSFVTHVREVTGRWPGFYSGHDIKKALGTTKDPVLANCWFWLAQYGPTAVVPPNWKRWTMWQYTDGSIGPEPRRIPGAPRIDRDLFNGSEEELRAFWGQ